MIHDIDIKFMVEDNTFHYLGGTHLKRNGKLVKVLISEDDLMDVISNLKEELQFLHDNME